VAALDRLDADVRAGRVTRVSIKLLNASAALAPLRSATFLRTEASAALARARGAGRGCSLLQLEALGANGDAAFVEIRGRFRWGDRAWIGPAKSERNAPLLWQASGSKRKNW
jgi:hypothetical protein